MWLPHMESLGTALPSHSVETPRSLERSTDSGSARLGFEIWLRPSLLLPQHPHLPNGRGQPAPRAMQGSSECLVGMQGRGSFTKLGNWVTSAAFAPSRPWR